MITRSKLKDYDIVLIEESKCNIKYTGVELKGPRPYLIINKSISQNRFLAAPLTSASNYPIAGKNQENWFLLKLSAMKKDSYIKLDHLILFDNADLQHVSIPNNYNTNVGTGNKTKIMKILVSLFIR